MRYCLWIFVLTAVAVAATACKQTIRQDEPLLGDGSRTKERSALPGEVADNSRCHVCHINYDEEELALNHEVVGVSCEKCHGASDAHCSDENNITPPDIMYSKASVNPSCMKCHPRDRIVVEDHHKPLLSGAAAQTKYCTGCHGRDHRVAVRTVRWDKRTGRLLGAGE